MFLREESFMKFLHHCSSPEKGVGGKREPREQTPGFTATHAEGAEKLQNRLSPREDDEEIRYTCLRKSGSWGQCLISSTGPKGQCRDMPSLYEVEETGRRWPRSPRRWHLEGSFSLRCHLPVRAESESSLKRTRCYTSQSLCTVSYWTSSQVNRKI